MTNVAGTSVGARRGRMLSAWPSAWPWIAVAVLVLGAGAAACFCSPALGVAALALPAAPLLVVAPDLAVLGLVVSPLVILALPAANHVVRRRVG